MATLSTVMKISFLFMTLTVSSFSGSRAIETVLDVNGSPVKTNVAYNIQSVDEPTKWVSVGKRTLNTLCPQAALLDDIATPVKFSTNTGSDTVQLSTSLSVEFEKANECSDSGIWKIDYNPLIPVADVTATGTLYYPDSSFKIEKYSDGYKFAHSSDVEGLSVYADPITTIDHLVKTPDSPLKVNFVPVTLA